MTIVQHLEFIACVAVAGYVQNLTGFAFGLVLLGLVGLLHVASLPDVANVVSALTLVNAIALFKAQRPQVDRAVLAPTLGASLVGVLVGVLVLNWLSDNVVAGLRLLLGVTILACAVVLILEAGSLARRSSTTAFAMVGLVSGVLGGLFSTAGPPLVYHFYRQPMSMRSIRDSLVSIFAANAVVRILLVAVTAGIASDGIWLSMEAVPLVLAQTYWMIRHPTRLSPQTVKRVVCILLIIVGVGLVAPSVKALWASADRPAAANANERRS